VRQASRAPRPQGWSSPDGAATAQADGVELPGGRSHPMPTRGGLPLEAAYQSGGVGCGAHQQRPAAPHGQGRSPVWGIRARRPATANLTWASSFFGFFML
jgi:hypothetical protein